uniref:Uncharacterized protein n=1 Tax=Populus trichocarpa TaxID=3694 RepID=A0A2K2AL79_POPTR
MWTHLERQAGGRVGYTNAGKSTLLLNQLTGADCLLKIGYLRHWTFCVYETKTFVATWLTEAGSIYSHEMLVLFGFFQMKNGNVFSLWNLFQWVSDVKKLKMEAERKQDVVCVSAMNGDGLQEFCNSVREKLKDSMVWVEALFPFDKGKPLKIIHQVRMVERTESGTLIKAHVPLRFARLLTPMRQLCKS